MEITIAKNVLLALDKFRSSDPLRPNICGIYFEYEHTGMCRGIATDGHKALIMQWTSNDKIDDAKSFSFLMSAEAVKAALKLKPTKIDPFIHITPSSVVSGDMKIEIAIEPVGEKYPDWRKIMPETHDNCEYASYHPHLLGCLQYLPIYDFPKVRIFFSKFGISHLMMCFHGKYEYENIEYFGFIAPVRDDTEFDFKTICEQFTRKFS